MNIKKRDLSSKIEKKNNLLESGFKLFLEKGINNTTIQEIVDKAKVAKGTFYLYFKDKFELQESLIITKSKELFDKAIEEEKKSSSREFDKQIIFIIDYVINEFIKNPKLIKFMSKSLSMGVFSKKLKELLEDDHIGLYDKFKKGILDNNIKLKNPKVTLFMIIELTSSTCFTSILKNEPLPIDEFKPFLYNTISNMILNEKI